jgi:hypothetical protein
VRPSFERLASPRDRTNAEDVGNSEDGPDPPWRELPCLPGCLHLVRDLVWGKQVIRVESLNVSPRLNEKCFVSSRRCSLIRLRHHLNFIRLKLSCDCQSRVSRTVIDNDDLFLAPGLCDRVGKAFTVSQKAMRTHRTPKALCAKSWEGPILFRESLRSAHASTRRFWERPLSGSHHFTFVTLFCEFAWSIDAQSNLIRNRITKHKRRMSVRKHFLVSSIVANTRSSERRRNWLGARRFSHVILPVFFGPFFFFLWKW